MTTVLKTELRENLGSRGARKLRAGGRIPAVVHFTDTHVLVHLSIDEHEFLVARNRHEHVYEIEFEGKTEIALVNELQWDTFGERIQHVEFKRVIAGQKTEAEVQIDYFGTPKGGLLNHLMTHITILADPMKIPDSLRVQIEGLEPGAAILASAVELPEEVELVTPVDQQVAMILAPRGLAEDEETPAEGEVPEEGAEAAPEGDAPAAESSGDS